jgi:hypothetical protein
MLAMISDPYNKEVEVTENSSAPDQPAECSHVRAFALRSGAEFVVFFASSEAELPDDQVRLELRVLAIRDRKDQKRSVLGTIASDVISGAIGGATWAAIASTYTALAEYLKRKHGAPTADVATVVHRLTEAGAHIPGSRGSALENLQIKQLEDKRWEAKFTRSGVAVRATLDPGATIVRWTERGALVDGDPEPGTCV